ncbi:TonB-dependent receptor [Flavobacterium sp. UBA7680]|uniref:TonB-dependent receptor n=1 Tax=Flavobacterium sp. UBA7680 TaxID=1946559 RepID=UPI0025BF138F|nr:TonB-dependent receptor [Flavobacterium sp. UBA7680]
MKITKQLFFKLLFLMAFAWNASAQEKVTLSGTISDDANNETLIGVNIYIKELKTGIVTNEYGFYSISVPKGKYELQVSYIGYKTIIQNIALNASIKKNIALESDSEQLQEVVINSNDKSTITNIRKPEMSTNKLTIQEIKKMPAVLGEVDVLKSVLQLPGVTNSGEGSNGFNVRGGSTDQNLILLDEATVYNSSHVFGFFSVFNSDAIKDIKLYKGGIPAKYGGRVSSVLDIYQKDGNSNEFHMNGGIGLISSRLMAEGPITKGRGSFLVAGRGSYAHLFMKLSDNKNSAYFYDLNAKLSYKLSDNNTLFASGYFGRDTFKISEDFSNTYGNSIFNLRWNHLFSDKLFSNLSVIYSDYDYGLDLPSEGLTWKSGIKNYNFKYDFKHYASDKLKLTYGVNAMFYAFNPGTVSPFGSSSGINFKQLDKKYAAEPSIYVQAEQELTDRLSVNYGLRYNMFYRIGETENIYANDQAVVFNDAMQIYQSATPISVKNHDGGEVIASFDNLEPRIAVAYQLSENESFKASYNRMSQYLHLISNTTSATPLDVWAPSDKFIKPEILDQVAFGYFKNFKDGAYSLEAETFYKRSKNHIDYIDGADLIANNAIEQVVLTGKSRSYGLELLVRKNTGKLTGFASYTLSRSEQQTPGRTANETGINNGEWYRSSYDKMHNLSVTGAYQVTEKWSFGGIFALQSGRAATFPNGQYSYGGMVVPTFEGRNKSNFAAYHHLDLSATYIPKPDKNKGWQSEWVFSVYNIYNRANAASMSFRQNETSGANEAVKMSIFGIIPSVTYNFKF